VVAEPERSTPIIQKPTTGQPCARFEVFSMMKFQIGFLWVVTPCSKVVGYHAASTFWAKWLRCGGSMALRNVCILPHHYMVSKARRSRPEFWATSNYHCHNQS